MSKTRHRDEWRERLRLACDISWKKRSAIAEDAGSSAATLSRIITGRMPRPSLDLVARLAHAAGTTVGTLLQEPGYRLSANHRTRLIGAAIVIGEILDDDLERRSGES